MPTVTESVSVYYASPGAPWVADLGDPDAATFRAAIAARVTVVFDDTSAKLSHVEEYETIFTDLGDRFDPESGVAVDYDDRDFEVDRPDSATYEIPDANLAKASWFRAAQTKLKDHLYRTRTITIFKNAKLKLYSRPGESRSEFLERCDMAAQNAADASVAKLRDKYRVKVKRAKDQYANADRRVSELETDVRGARQTEGFNLAGSLLGMLSGRKSARSMASSARRRQVTRSKEQRLVTAQEKAMDKWNVIATLEQDLTDEVAEINDTWEIVSLEIEEVEIGLEKMDISVDDFVLVWIPVKID